VFVAALEANECGERRWHKAGDRRITWLVPNDGGGGVVSVAQACCRQAALAGHNVTLLMMVSPTGHAAEFGDFRVESLGAKLPYADVPQRIVGWMRHNPQDIVVLNGCEEADAAIPHIPADTRVVYAVHDTAPRYFNVALRHEAAIDAVVAVSETVASRFGHRLRDANKLRIAHNGTVFPLALNFVLSSKREDDIVFLGGDNHFKGAFDVIALWKVLQRRRFAGHLHWFGEVGAALRSQIARLPDTSRILLRGQTPRQEIFETAARSRIVLPLSRVESFGMATIECMGMGCLAAAWDVKTGTREIVSVEQGAFAPLGDYNRLADGVLGLLAAHEQRYVASTVRIRSTFDDRAMWARYDETFAWMNGRKPAKRPACGTIPPLYEPPIRLFQLLPNGVRQTVRNIVGRSPHLGYWLGDMRY
jgi:Glycosyl transferases group 1/Glycosyltransferase Family 4